MNLAAMSLQGGKLQIDTLRDVNETAAIVYDAKRDGGKSGVLILGGGSPKNFILQTEPQIQEVLGLAESGHDYFLQVTDARPDTGGLSGATASEAMTWGKVDPDKLPDSVTCYTDSTIALPLLTAYALARHAPRPLRRLYRAARRTTRRSARTTRRDWPRTSAVRAERQKTDLTTARERILPSTEDDSMSQRSSTRFYRVDPDDPDPSVLDEAAGIWARVAWSRSRPRPSTGWGRSPPAGGGRADLRGQGTARRSIR